MSLPRTLVVAPITNLLYSGNEVQQVVNTLGAQMLREQADIHGLLEILKQDFDIVWFSTHGDEKGVYLNDGILNTSEITALVRSTRAKLVVLNTCSSRAVALSIYDELRIPLVCTLRPVPDRTAFIFGTLFARKIALGTQPHQAFLNARPGQDFTYVYLPEAEIEVQMPPPEQQNSRQENHNDFVRLNNSVNRMEILVSGSKDYGVKGLVPTVANLETKIDNLGDKFEKLEESLVFQRRLLYTVTVISIALFIVAMVLVYQRGG